MPRAGLTADTVIERAAQLLDERAPDGLNLAALAESLGVRTPSLYKHIDGLPGLRRGIMLRAKADLSHALGHAAIGRSREDAITRMSLAYRRWALEHPAQYPMTMSAPTPGDAADEQVSSDFFDIVFDVLAGYDLHGDDAVDATRFFRSALHGFVDLETGGGFRIPIDLERSFERLIDSVATALSTWARTA